VFPIATEVSSIGNLKLVFVIDSAQTNDLCTLLMRVMHTVWILEASLLYALIIHNKEIKRVVCRTYAYGAVQIFSLLASKGCPSRRTPATWYKVETIFSIANINE